MHVADHTLHACWQNWCKPWSRGTERQQEDGQYCVPNGYMGLSGSIAEGASDLSSAIKGSAALHLAVHQRSPRCREQAFSCSLLCCNAYRLDWIDNVLLEPGCLIVLLCMGIAENLNAKLKPLRALTCTLRPADDVHWLITDLALTQQIIRLQHMQA